MNFIFFFLCMCVCTFRREDAGLLVYKDHLPVNQVVVGDTNRGGSEAKLTVGSLRCRGDCECLRETHVCCFTVSSVKFIHVSLFPPAGNFWNAASFSSPASYLHFPSFRGETSTDISFYFKTSSTHGVFLENLGVNDLLHIELRGVCVCVLVCVFKVMLINK